MLDCEVALSKVVFGDLDRRDAKDANLGNDRCPPMTGEFKGCSLRRVGPSEPPSINLYQCWIPLSQADPTPTMMQIECPIINTRSVSIDDTKVPSCPAPLPKDCTLTPGPKVFTPPLDLGVAHHNRTWLCETHTQLEAPKFWWVECLGPVGTCDEVDGSHCAGAQVYPRSTVTTKVTAPAASVGVPATVTF